MTAARFRPLVLIPSYNTGPRLAETVREARAQGAPVLVVIDGSDDGSADLLEPAPGLELLVLAANGGKGAAVAAGARAAGARGFTHLLTLDADGQHPATAIPAFLAAAAAAPAAMILGWPLFGPEAPAARVRGRRISNALAKIEAPGGGIGDCLFGFRVYPLAPLLAVLAEGRWMRGFDFDPEVAVRLAWRGVRAVNLPAPCRYLGAAEGGVSHFRYGRDNLLLAGMHLRLLAGMVSRRLLGRGERHRQR